VRELSTRPGRRGPNVVSIDSGAGLSNATLQQRLVPVRLLYDFLIEEGLRESNPVGRGRYTPGRGGPGSQRGLVPRLTKLPWIPSDLQWLGVLELVREEPARNRVMLALAYDAALRREELCSLGTDDLDPARRTIRVRAETTKNRRERVVPYSAATGVLLSEYLRHRAAISRARGPLFLSESRRNHGQPLTLWTWSKVIRKIAVAADLPLFSTHTTRHLCLTRPGPDGLGTARHRHVRRPPLDRVHAEVHPPVWPGPGRQAGQEHGPRPRLAGRAAHRHRLPSGRPAVTRVSQAVARQIMAPVRPWSLEVVGYDRSAALTMAEQNALEALGWELRRWPHCWHDPGQDDWPVLHRLVLPLAAAKDRLDVPEENDFQRRSAADAVALVLRGCAARRTSFWAWDAAAWAEVLGPSRTAFQDRYPGWADSSARTYAIGLAYLFGFTELNLLGNVGRAAVARKVFGSARVDDAVGQVTSVLHGWGHRSPQVTVRTESLVCHALLLNRSPFLEDLSAEFLQDLRANVTVPYSLRQNVHSLHRALAALGLTSPPRPPSRLACPPVEGVTTAWAGWVQRWHDTSPLPPRGRKGRRNQMLRMGGGWPPSTPRSKSPASGHASCAPPGSLRSTGSASGTTSSPATRSKTASASL